MPKATFPRRQRLTHALEFQAVFGARMRKSSGPVALFAKPNGLAFPRLGLSVSRAVGGAVVRNRFKRLIREAFRLHWREFPVREQGAYDVVISAKAHKGRTLDEYAAMLLDMIEAADRDYLRREGRKGEA